MRFPAELWCSATCASGPRIEWQCIQPAGPLWAIPRLLSIRRVQHQISQTLIPNPLNAAPRDNSTCCPLHDPPSVVARLHLAFQTGHFPPKSSAFSTLWLFIWGFPSELQCLRRELDVLAADAEALNLNVGESTSGGQQF